MTTVGTQCDCGNCTKDVYNDLLKANILLERKLDENNQLYEKLKEAALQKQSDMEWEILRYRQELKSRTNNDETVKLSAKIDSYSASMKRLEQELADSRSRGNRRSYNDFPPRRSVNVNDIRARPRTGVLGTRVRT